MSRIIIGWVCIVTSLSFYGLLALHNYHPDLSLKDIDPSVGLYCIPLLIGIGVLRKSVLSLWLALGIFFVQFVAFFSMGYSAPLKVSYLNVSSFGYVRIDITALIWFILTLIAIFEPSDSKAQEERIEPTI